MDNVSRARDGREGVVGYVAQGGFLPVYSEGRIVDGPEDAGLGAVDC